MLASMAQPAMDMESYRQAKNNALREFDMLFFANVIAASGGSLKKALALSGMHKKNFYEKLKELHLSVKSGANAAA